MSMRRVKEKYEGVLGEYNGTCKPIPLWCLKREANKYCQTIKIEQKYKEKMLPYREMVTRQWLHIPYVSNIQGRK